MNFIIKLIDQILRKFGYKVIKLRYSSILKREDISRCVPTIAPTETPLLERLRRQTDMATNVWLKQNVRKRHKRHDK